MSEANAGQGRKMAMTLGVSQACSELRRAALLESSFLGDSQACSEHWRTALSISCPSHAIFQL